MVERHQGLATKSDLDQLKKELSTKIDANGGKIEENGGKIEANSSKIDQVEKNLSAKIDANSAKIDANSAALSRISNQVVENTQQIGQLLVTTDEFKGYFHKIMSSLDVLTSGFADMNNELVAMNARLDRIEKDVQELKAR